MGLNHTTLDSWRQWQSSRRRLHTLKDHLTPASAIAPPRRLFWRRGVSQPSLLVVCDSNSPTNHHSLLAPLAAGDQPVVVVAPEHVTLDLPGDGWQRVDEGEALGGIRAVASSGDHLGTGDWAHDLARRRGWHQWVVQHGLLSPFAPPPPPGSTVLAWSEADAAFVSHGRSDLRTEVVGSALLDHAASKPAPHVSRFATPVFLGQLHGAELPRWAMTRSVTAFWRETGATYRPHPREEDKASLLQHRLWQRMGMTVDKSGSLAGLEAPVVAAFSTGILEAAARGLPAWVFHLDPPTWLVELWERYDLQRWGSERPTRWASSTTRPDRAIADLWSRS